MANKRKKMNNQASRKKANRKNSSKSLLGRTNFSSRNLLVFAVIFAAVGGYIVWKSLAAPRLPVQPFALAERYTDRNLKQGCVSEDDNLSLVGNQGYLNPGQSFTYTTNTPDCSNDRVINMSLSWGSNTKNSKAQLQLTAAVPASEKWAAYGSAYYLAEDATGKILNATYSGSGAKLCMFSHFDDTPRNYSLTITNTSTSKVSGINFLSTDDNDWPDDWNQCKGSDADRDGFSDAYEHYMAYMSQGGTLSQPWSPPVGTNYLKACNDSTPDNEFDAWPPDTNDDGVVTQADADIAQSYIGQGDGHNWVGINITPGYYNLSTGAWRRFDLNTDGYVTSADIDIIRTFLGKSCPVS
jgi:hypothetical protein